MKVFISFEDDGVLVQARAEGGGNVGDLSRTVRPGGGFMGWSCEELKALGAGEHDLEPKED